MENYSVYEDILRRTGGDIYIGVVGPVRTGKSTFIRRFMEALVLPYADESVKAVMTDELPQASSGRTIMTTEPKFVPAQSAQIATPTGVKASVRLVDCVGYVVEGAMGFEEEGRPRLVKTPWANDPIPFAEAAKIGTERVIKEHSTVGVLITTDGSFTPVERAAYEVAEARAAAELKALGKPFVVVLNCVDVRACEGLRTSLEERYGVPVVAMNVEQMGESGALEILQAVLLEFPIRCLDVSIPGWLQALPEGNPFVDGFMEKLKAIAPSLKKMKDCRRFFDAFADTEDYIPADGLDMEIRDDCALMLRLKSLADDGRRYAKIKSAWEEAEATGYGVVCPEMEELHLAEPTLVKKGSNYGVRFRAAGASYHIMKVEIDGQVEPIVGGKSQGESFCSSLLEAYEQQPEKVWETNVFGNSVRQLLEVELGSKNKGVPEELKGKFRRTLSKIVNEGKGGFLCILL